METAEAAPSDAGRTRRVPHERIAVVTGAARGVGHVAAVAFELGEHGVTVDASIPGLIDTALTRHRQRCAQADGDLSSAEATPVLEREAKETLIAKTPLGVPWTEPEDVAPVVVFPAPEAARMVTGATYDATGGDSAHNLGNRMAGRPRRISESRGHHDR